MKNDYSTVEYEGKKYIVAVTNQNEPYVFDDQVIKKLPDKMFYKNKTTGYIYYGNVLLHHIVKPYSGTSVDHLNQIKTDNREVNLRYATQSQQNKNQMKRKRNVKLPEGCGINPDNIPTFIWYIKDNCSHGDRWMVEIKDKYNWKTTSSKEYSTKLKFELAKKHLRELTQKQPELFVGHCINGELNEKAEKLKKEYIEILRLSGYEYDDKIKSFCINEDTTGLTENEVVILYRDIDTTKAKNSPNTINDIVLPKYCQYIRANDKRGDGFCIGRNHPKQNGKDWSTSRSKRVTTSDKYNQMIQYLGNLNNN
jgi:hypothetical protein